MREVWVCVFQQTQRTSFQCRKKIMQNNLIFFRTTNTSNQSAASTGLATKRCKFVTLDAYRVPFLWQRNATCDAWMCVNGLMGVWNASGTFEGVFFVVAACALLFYRICSAKCLATQSQRHRWVDGALENSAERTKNRFRFANNTVWFCVCNTLVCLHTETTDFVHGLWCRSVYRNIALSPASEATFHCHFNLLIKYEERTKKYIIACNGEHFNFKMNSMLTLFAIFIGRKKKITLEQYDDSRKWTKCGCT